MTQRCVFVSIHSGDSPPIEGEPSAARVSRVGTRFSVFFCTTATSRVHTGGHKHYYFFFSFSFLAYLPPAVLAIILLFSIARRVRLSLSLVSTEVE